MFDDEDRKVLAMATVIGSLGVAGGVVLAFTAGLMWRVFQLAAG